MERAHQTPTSYEALPVVLEVSHIQQIMGISKVSAYQLVHSGVFPVTQIKGRLIRVSKRTFFDWLEKGGAECR